MCQKYNSNYLIGVSTIVEASQVLCVYNIPLHYADCGLTMPDSVCVCVCVCVCVHACVRVCATVRACVCI